MEHIAIHCEEDIPTRITIPPHTGIVETNPNLAANPPSSIESLPNTLT